MSCRQDPCSASGCPVTTMCLLYDQPIELLPYDPSLPKYACSDNPYYLRRRKARLTDCRLSVNYGVDLNGFDTAYIGVYAPYHVGLQNCLNYSCVTMACHGTDRCFLKTSTLEENPQAIGYYSHVNFWNPVCQKG
ncbi:uncharacterized protein LOC119591126 [Penaeus monodon]|uniref:uncharacterized protein LOC119591126 n=1 Tax=Penaeus monodon TaxID=6687 RepID=UPI0018A6E5F2|nr:uncharacterized protein LOC119591126 [Penaeus monodon]